MNAVKSSSAFIISLHNIPWRLFSIGISKHSIFCHWIFNPLSARFNIHWAYFPLSLDKDACGCCGDRAAFFSRFFSLPLLRCDSVERADHTGSFFCLGCLPGLQSHNGMGIDYSIAYNDISSFDRIHSCVPRCNHLDCIFAEKHETGVAGGHSTPLSLSAFKGKYRFSACSSGGPFITIASGNRIK